MATDQSQGDFQAGEAETAEDRLLFRQFAENIPTLAWIANADGYITWYNRRWHEYCGTTAEQMEGWGWQSVHDPAALPRVLERWQYAISTGQPLEMTFPLRGADGVFRPFLTRIAPWRDASGRIARWFGTNTDVSLRAAAEKQVRDSEARLRALTDNLPGGAVYQMSTGRGGEDRRFLYLSPSYEQLTGVPPEAVMKDPSIAYNMALPEYRDVVAKAEAEAIPTRSLFDVETRFRRADGEVRWCRIISAPREQEDGALIWEGLEIDITEKKELEEDLRRLNETLEKRVEERTAELLEAQEALRQSQKLEAMGQLTGGVAHDFNNLLSPIIGGLDLLQLSGFGGPREQRLIEAALQSAERAKTLVQRLLAFARRQPLQPRRVDVGVLVTGMAGLIGSTAGPQVHLAVRVPADLPPAKADPNQLELALLNLCVNARDAMPDGGTLTIAAEARTVERGDKLKLRAGRYVRVSVADTGVGMDEETLARAVEPFFSTKGIGKGTGLGLSMAHGLAEQLGGILMLSSRPGLGTCVELWLPVSAEDEERKVAHSLTEIAKGGEECVLLVDDEPLVRASTATMLSALGYGVIEAESGSEALRLMEERPVELIVSDQLMPGMTGTELAAEVGQRWPGIPVLIISGYADLESISPNLPRLNKPFRRRDLADAIEEAKRALAH
jgi:PAS domain S-box-containing protein